MPKELRKLQPDSDVVRLQKILSDNGYFPELQPADGIFEDVTHDAVMLFQRQHIDSEGKPLEPDGVVGGKTWWALEHPSGESQRSNFAPIIPQGITATRRGILSTVYEEHAQDVREIPDGSNRGPEIDRYWGRTGVIGAPWCCAFVSWVLFETLGKFPIGGKHHLGVQRMWRAAKRLDMEVEAPRPGDIFIQIGSRGTGHTGFVVGVSPDGKTIYTGEGNSGNRLKIGRRSVSTIDHFIDCLQDGQDESFTRLDLDVRALEGQRTR
jgi:hypothetical protein